MTDFQLSGLHNAVKLFRDHKREFIIISPIIIALLCYTATRAVKLSFTYDESVSYLVIHALCGTSIVSANTHPINSILMVLFGRLFGESEISLRLPNLLAHCLFILFSFLVMCRVRSKTMAACGFLLLNGNPFMLEFFSLARGYGLSLAFLMGSIFFLTQLEEEISGVAPDYFMSFFCAALATFSNFTLLNFYLALLVIFVLKVFLTQREALRKDFWSLVRKHRYNLVIGTVPLVPAALALLLLKRRQCLFEGGHHGFWPDTVKSLISASINLNPNAYAAQTIVIASTSIMIAISLMIIGLASLLLSKDVKSVSFPLLMAFLMILCVTACLLQFHIFGILLPMSRTGLYFIPLFFMSMISLADHILNRCKRITRTVIICSITLITILTCIQSIASANYSHTYTWDFDANTHDAVCHLFNVHGTDSPTFTILGVDRLFFPTIMYYKYSRQLTWLEVTRDVNYDYPAAYDYLYVLKRNGSRFIVNAPPASITAFSPAETLLIRTH